MAKFTTEISDVTHGSVVIRGYSHEEIMRELTYAQGAFLTMVGRLPSEAESRLLDAVLNSLLDHGFVAATVSAARYIASGNPQFVPAVAGGLLAAGQNTLSPEHAYELIDRAFELQQEKGLTEQETAAEVVQEYRGARKRIPGFGHPFHKAHDFRATVLFELAGELGLLGPATRMYRAVHAEFVRQTGKTDIPINIDGCLAALGRDLGLTADQTVGFALLAVLPGLMAHVSEEISSKASLRWIEDGEYTGPALRTLHSIDATAPGAKGGSRG
jgi:citrate synthase